MPINPTPDLQVPYAAPDQFQNASFFDVTLVRMIEALIASGKYAPGPLIMQLGLAATSQLMVETGRWDGVPSTIMSLEQAQAEYKRLGIG